MNLDVVRSQRGNDDEEDEDEGYGSECNAAKASVAHTEQDVEVCHNHILI